MTPNMLRQLWSLVESAQSRQILDLDDYSLINWLIAQMNSRHSSAEQSYQETHVLEGYIRDHLLLIRDIADDVWIDDTQRASLASC